MIKIQNTMKNLNVHHVYNIMIISMIIIVSVVMITAKVIIVIVKQKKLNRYTNRKRKGLKNSLVKIRQSKIIQ